MQKYSSFTLLEVLIAIAIFVILVGAIGFAINPRRLRNEAEDATLKKGISSLAGLIETYRQTTGLNEYPTDSNLASFEEYLTGYRVTSVVGSPTYMYFENDSIETGHESNNWIYYQSPAGSEEACLEAITNVDPNMYFVWTPGIGVELVDSSGRCITF